MNLKLRKFAPQDLFRSLYTRLENFVDQSENSSLSKDRGVPLWHATDYLYNNTCTVFQPCTDIYSDQTIKTLHEVKNTLKENNKNNLMIFPLVEQRFWRNHWVTVIYNPQTSEACLIDSRPWYIAMWYPTGRIKEMLGAKSLKHVYQGVQHNDIYCGTWTRSNIEVIVNLCSEDINEIAKSLKYRFTKDMEEDLYNECKSTLDDLASSSSENKTQSKGSSYGVIYKVISLLKPSTKQRIEQQNPELSNDKQITPKKADSDSDWDDFEKPQFN